jgi:DNA-binding GntR family transcriptional regulator
MTSTLDLVAIADAHLPILDALRRGDPNLTGKVMREHIATFADHLLTGATT